MYELEYVRKRKRRKFIALGAGVSTTVITSMAIISFLGRFVGTFTVSLETRNVELTLSEKADLSNQSSYLRVNSIAPFQEFTYSDFSIYGDEVIDSDKSSIDLGGNQDANGDVESLNFFKYTFFVGNIGGKPAQYDLSLNVVEDVVSSDNRSLLDTVRVMVYEDGEKEVYAKGQTKPHTDENGNASYASPISVDKDEANDLHPFMGYAKEFVSSDVVAAFSSVGIDVGQVKRYTIVTWLEGFRSSSDQLAPKGATIKLGVEINAYEIQ